MVRTKRTAQCVAQMGLREPRKRLPKTNLRETPKKKKKTAEKNTTNQEAKCSEPDGSLSETEEAEMAGTTTPVNPRVSMQKVNQHHHHST